MGLVNHKTRPVKVWVDIDLDIVSMVECINTMPGIRTHASCQGSIGEGGPWPYDPYVEVSWQNEAALKSLKARYEVEVVGENWGHAHPRVGARENESYQSKENMVETIPMRKVVAIADYHDQPPIDTTAARISTRTHVFQENSTLQDVIDWAASKQPTDGLLTRLQIKDDD